jgi:hypothetical protein
MKMQQQPVLLIVAVSLRKAETSAGPAVQPYWSPIHLDLAARGVSAATESITMISIGAATDEVLSDLQRLFAIIR